MSCRHVQSAMEGKALCKLYADQFCLGEGIASIVEEPEEVQEDAQPSSYTYDCSTYFIQKLVNIISDKIYRAPPHTQPLSTLASTA